MIGHRNPEMIYTFGEFELDARLYELRAPGGPRPVEPQVFDVLMYLVKNRDRVVSKHELLENVWADRFVSEATLSSRLMAARKAVGDDAKRQSWIKTIHGRGYRFVGEVNELAGAVVYPDAPSSAVPAAPPVKADPAGGALPMVVGRDEEIGRLREAIEAAAGGTRQVVFVTGEAGAGKTTLVQAVLASLPHALRARVARGQCLEHRGTGEAYLPLFEALERICRAPGGDEIAAVLRRTAPTWVAQMPSLREGAADGEAGTGRERMLREIAAALEEIAAESPLILVLEDLHWSDYSTLDLLTTVARRPEVARLAIVGTYRPADARASRHPLYGIAHELLIRGECRTIALPLLGEPELERFIGSRLPEARFGRAVARILHQRTSGNPLFAQTTLDAWVAHGLVKRDASGWALVASPADLLTSIPDSLAHLIEQQVSELPVPDQQLLEAASAVGRAFSAAAIAAAVGGTEGDVELACATLARDGRFLRSSGVEVWRDGTISEKFSFTHDLYPDVLYGRLPAGRRARLHAAIGARLERGWSGAEEEHAAELALHFSRGRDHERALRYGILAAKQALRRSAHHEALEHLNAALDALAFVPESDERLRSELWTRAAIGNAIVATRGWGEEEAETNFLRAREIAHQLADAAKLSSVIYGLATMYEFRGEYAKAEALIEERLGIETAPSAATLLQSHELLTCSLMHQGRYSESLAHAEEAFALVDAMLAAGERPSVTGIQCHGWASAALMFMGQPDAALVKSRLVADLSRRTDDDLGRSIGFLQSAFIHFYRREAADATAFTEQALAIGFEQRYPFVVGVGRVLRGWCMAELREPLESALNEIRSGLRTCCMIGVAMDLPLLLSIQADVALRAGAGDEARTGVDRAIAMLEQTRSYFYTPEVWRLRGVISLTLDREEEEAASWFRRALELARAQGSPILTLRAATSLASVDSGAAAGVETALAALREGLEMEDVRLARDLLRRVAS